MTDSETPASFGHKSLLTQRAALAILDFIDPVREAVTAPGFSPLIPQPGEDEKPPTATPLRETFKIGIIGAGAAGLFTAMIFDHLKDTYGLNVEYEILEARPKERLGGRLYTHHFKAGAGHPAIGPHDYYDVGAMRFPESNIMARVFKLFEVLQMNKHTSPGAPAKGSLVKYQLKDPKQPSLYNGIKVVLGNNPATANAYSVPGIPPHHRDKSVGELIKEAIKPFTDLFDPNNPGLFWRKVLAEAEPYSVRQFFTQIKQYHFNTVQLIETLAYGDGWYNQGLTDCIIEDIIFSGNMDWWCVEGGSEQLSQKMFSKIKRNSHMQFGKTVTEMEHANLLEQIRVQVRGESTARVYDAVFNSAPLGAMQRMQLNGLGLNWQTRSAMRSLAYGASCKLGVRFKNLWWIKHFDITTGGAARTDLPIRQCVYPSYNTRDNVDGPGVLLVSYCWGQEATRLGALIDRQSPKGEAELKEVLIHDLARLHVRNDSAAEYKRVHDIISNSYLDHFAHDWNTDPYSAGAFAYYGPGQYKHMFQGITASDGKHMIIGEAASAYHGWVVGALDSAVRGVFQFLARHAEENNAARAALLAYINNTVPSPYGPLPAEYRHIPYMDADLQPLVGEEKHADMFPPGALALLQVEVEKMRLGQHAEELDLKDEKLDLNHFREVLFKGLV